MEKVYFVFFCIYVIASYGLMIACGDTVSKWTESTAYQLSSPTGILNEVSDDWQTASYTSIWTTTDSDCGPNATEVYSRLYAGTSLGCDCLGIYSQYITGDNSMVWGSRCTYNQTRYGCMTAPAVWPIWQSQFNQTRVCGTQVGDTFLQANRLNKNMTCPQGTQRCSSSSSNENTLCVTSLDKCPITFIDFVQSGSSLYQSYSKNSEFQVSGSIGSLQIVTSKTVDQLPVTTTKVAYEPCMNPMVQTTAGVYLLELDRDTQCPQERNTGLFTDPRYNRSADWQMSLGMLEDQNAVSAEITRLPGYYKAANLGTNPQVKYQYPLSTWQRSTINWNLQCELNGTMTRSQAYPYYATRLLDPKMALKAHDVAEAAFIEAICFVSIIGLILIFRIFTICCCSADKNDNDWVHVATGVIFVCSRIASIVTLGILFKRVNDSYYIAEGNIQILQGMMPFYNIQQYCADPLSIMNVPMAIDGMTTGAQNSSNCYWITLAALIWFCIEPAMAGIMVCCKACLCNGSSMPRGYGADSETKIIGSRESMINNNYTDDHFRPPENTQFQQVSPPGGYTPMNQIGGYQQPPQYQQQQYGPSHWEGVSDQFGQGNQMQNDFDIQNGEISGRGGDNDGGYGVAGNVQGDQITFRKDYDNGAQSKYFEGRFSNPGRVDGQWGFAAGQMQCEFWMERK